MNFYKGEGLKEVDLGDFQLRQDKGKEVEEQQESSSSIKARDSEFDPIRSLIDEDLFDVGEGGVAEKSTKPSQEPKKKKDGPPTWLIKIIADAVLL